jgi:Family of unknown function (DUF6152)
MRTHVIAAGCLVLILAGLTGARAHHSFGEYYLESDTIEIEGRVVEFQYKNPHTWIHIDGQDPFGRQMVYAAEWGSVSALERQGILKNTLKVGDRVRVWASPGRNPNDNRVRLKRIQLPDGRTVGGQNRNAEQSNQEPRNRER